MKKTTSCKLFTMFVFLVILPSVLSGQPVNQEQEIKQKIDALQDSIKISVESESPKNALNLGVTLDQLKERGETLQEIQAYYNRLLNALVKQRELEQELTALANKIKSGEVFRLEQDPPYTLQFYDDYALKISDSTNNRQSAEMSHTIFQKSLDNSNVRLKEAGQRLRTLKETLAGNKDAASPGLEWEIGKMERELELAQAAGDYYQIALQNSKKRIELVDKHLEINQQNLTQIRKQLTFNKSDLEKQLTAIEERNNELLTESNDIIKKMQQQEVLSVRAQKKIEKTITDSEKESAKTSAATVDASRLFYQRKFEQNENLQIFYNMQKQIWKRRYYLINGDYNKNDLTLWKKDALSHSDRIQTNITLEQNQQAAVQLQLAALEDKLTQSSTLPDDILQDLQSQHRTFKKMIEISSGYLKTISTMQQMTNRFIEALEALQSQMTFGDLVSHIASKIPAIWHFELMVVDDRGITIGKIIIALCILILGIFIIGRITKMFIRRLLHRTRMSASSVAITEKLLYYTLFLMILLWAMNIVNIPLTAFTFLGGAVAIGVGFGAQQLFNNFISGFILMAEKPIKVGDLIQLESEIGWIEDIGVRATKVRTFSNTNILVPNSYFLEHNITNWTHSDKIVRGQITVGVAYGSPAEKVKDQLLLAAEQHPEVLKKPASYVYFDDFGDNALVFNLYFWISITDMTGRQRIGSEIRFIIDRLFREASLVIAFPQRDMHLDAQKPLRVEMINSPSKTASVDKQGANHKRE